jgi:hypothetical protein
MITILLFVGHLKRGQAILKRPQQSQNLKKEPKVAIIGIVERPEIESMVKIRFGGKQRE